MAAISDTWCAKRAKNFYPATSADLQRCGSLLIFDLYQRCNRSIHTAPVKVFLRITVLKLQTGKSAKQFELFDGGVKQNFLMGCQTRRRTASHKLLAQKPSKYHLAKRVCTRSCKLSTDWAILALFSCKSSSLPSSYPRFSSSFWMTQETASSSVNSKLWGDWDDASHTHHLDLRTNDKLTCSFWTLLWMLAWLSLSFL